MIAVQLLGSLAAVLLLAACAWKLGLGGDVRIRSEDEARRLARGAAHPGRQWLDRAVARSGTRAISPRELGSARKQL